MTTTTISGAGAHASAEATDRIPASKAGVKGYLTGSQLTTLHGATLVSDTAYDATSWNAVTGVAPSKNAVRDQIEAMVALQASDTAFAASWDGVTTIPPSKNAVYDAINGLVIGAAPISTGWLVPSYGEGAVPALGTGGHAIDTIYYAAIRIYRRITITDLAARVQTVSSGKNFALAIYAHDYTTGRPTGTPLAATGSMSLTTAAFVSADITGADVTLDPGIFWQATWTDVGSVGFTSALGQNSLGWTSHLDQPTTGSNWYNSTTPISHLTSAETFNSAAWPNAASEVFTRAYDGRQVAIINMRSA